MPLSDGVSVVETWPFLPRQITNDGGSSSASSPLRKLVRRGLISNNYLAACQTEICHCIRHPTTVTEFAPTGEPIRTDSPLLAYEIHPACRLLRRLTSDASTDSVNAAGTPCCRSDALHANFFFDQTRSTLTKSLPTRLEQCGDDLRNLYSATGRAVDVEQRVVDGRPLLTYDCPLLGLREMVFPVFVEDRVVAAFFVGQLSLRERLAEIDKHIRSLASWRPSWLSHCLPEHRMATMDEITDRLHNAHSTWLAENPNSVFDTDRYEDLLQKVADQLTRLESRLHEELQNQRQRYIGQKVAGAIESFRRKIPDEPARGNEQLQKLWVAAQETLEDIRRDFSFRYIVIFGLARATMEQEWSLQVVARTEHCPESLAKTKTHDVRMNLRALPNYAKRGAEYTPSLHPGVFADCFGAGSTEDWGDCRLILVGVPLHLQSSIAFLVGYSEDNSGVRPENLPNRDLDRALQSFNTVVVSSMSAILAASAEKDLADRMRILRHEVGQLTFGLDGLRFRYLRSPERLRALSEVKAQDLCRDVQGYLRQIHGFFELMRYSVDDVPELKQHKFLAFRELLFKWKDTYRIEAEAKSLEFCMPRVSHADPSRPEIFGDVLLLEQLVYNLVNNAVKYCHRGTRILLDCKLKSSRADSGNLLTVTNFGPPLPENIDIFELYSRGIGVQPEGLGIGLWVVRKVAGAHHGKVSIHSEQVSEFNIPLICPYLALDSGKDPQLVRRLGAELTRLHGTGQYAAALALDAKEERLYSPTSEETLNSILQPTFRVRFEVEIPSLSTEVKK